MILVTLYDVLPSYFQITIYVFFPVAVFYYFNVPDFFERFVEEKRVRTNIIYVL